MRLTLTLILVASVVVLAQPPPNPRGPVPPAPVPVTTPDPVTAYAWAPTTTITASELARLLPLFVADSPVVVPTGRLRIPVPRPPTAGSRGGQPVARAACPAHTPLFALTAEDTARLGALMKHLKACAP